MERGLVASRLHLAGRGILLVNQGGAELVGDWADVGSQVSGTVNGPVVQAKVHALFGDFVLVERA